MKLKLLLQILFFAVCSNLLFAQNFSLLSNDENSIEFEHTTNDFSPHYVSINGNEFLNFGINSAVLTAEKSSPALPFFAQSFQIPGKGEVNYQIVYQDFYEIENVNVAPSKGDLKRNIDPASVPYEFGEIYDQDQFYPGNLANMTEPYILRDTRGINIALFPYQYNPVQKKLRVYNDLKVIISTNPNVSGPNEIQSNSTYKSNVFHSIYQDQYLNPFNDPEYNTVGDIGSMLIVTDADFVEALLPLAKWKNQSGIRTEIVTTAETGNSDTQIKAFIEAYYTSHPDLVYILLAGDSDKIPSHTYGYNGEQLWSDSYYGQIDGGENDFHPELLVGRFSGNAQEIETMVSRTLEYEITPMQGNWMKNAIGIGSSEGDGYGNDGEADYQHIRNIRSQLMDFVYETVYEFYQGSQGGEDQSGEPTPSMVNNALDWGTGLFNYTGHGWLEGMATGNYTNADVANMNNHGKYPFVISVACNNGTFVNATTLGEAFMRAKNNGVVTGSIGFAGSSILMSWAPPMATQDEMTNILTEVYDNYRSTTLGGLFYNGQIGMLDEYNSDGTSKEVMQTWILFGDPSVVFRYDATQEINAEHADMIAADADHFYVMNCNAESGLATLSQGNTILGKGNILNGEVNIELNETINIDADLPVLTITKQNYTPYQAEIQMGILNVEDEILNQISIYPNPASQFVNIQNNTNQSIRSIEIRDITGRMIQNLKPESGKKDYQLNVSGYSKGTYVISIQLKNESVTKKILVK